MNTTTDPTDPTDQQIHDYHDYILYRAGGENLIKSFPDIRSKVVPGLWHKICDPVYVHIFRQTFPVKSKVLQVLQVLCHD
jgi:hypothetical protein